ncbi:MAG: type IV secretory system conjugative DNA transfer family protein [Planctomycetota bacterium]
MKKTLKWLAGITGAAVAVIGALFLLAHFASAEFISDNRHALEKLLLAALAVAVFTPLGAVVFWLAANLRGYLKRYRNYSDAKRHKRLNRTADAALARFGATQLERATRIDEVFDRKIEGIKIKIEKRGLKCDLERQLSAMSPREREALRTIYHLQNAGMMIPGNFEIIQLSLIFAQGKGTVFNGARYTRAYNNIRSVEDAIRIIGGAGDIDAAIDAALRELLMSLSRHPEHPMLKGLASRLFGDGGDLAPGAPLKAAKNDDVPRGGLILGLDTNNPDDCWFFDGEGSLITVAPPGAGKTQAQVFPNLLRWKGPAVVLDVKGEIYAQTSKWRRENVGPVYKFSPLDPEASHCFNPLTMVRSDTDYLWEDARFLADMMIVPSGAKDPFWENRARDVLTAAIARVCVEEDVNKRPMSAVLDILHGVGWTKFVSYLQARVDMRTMHRAGQSLGDMEQKTRDGVLQSALSSMSTWDGERIARATATSDWNPLDLRSGENPTIYICLRPNEINSYTSILRVLIAQHIRALTSVLPDKEVSPILFVLDELPRLKHMPPVEEALEIGRQYGIRLWMFTQSLGQLEQAYPNADGMVGSCAVRMFMNPSLYDETAQKISEDIGYQESIVDGTRVRVVEPNILAGPDFKDFVIVMASNAKPAKLKKYFAYEDENLTSKMGSP